MHYQVLARKWRPKNFDELIGQPHIVRTLKNSLTQKRIAQAYLLAGTRGVGKTTVARIFAKAIRCESLSADGNPCNECRSCEDMGSQSSMDIIEIDGASHNGVESIRTLIDNVQYLPTSGQYKVYVIDEVHMLSVSAFNALLKTLEEPPEHVIFIFATTEPDKLLKTVLSRCQRLDLRNVQEDTLAEHIQMIAKKENVKFENDSLIKELAALGKGSVRDTLSLLDQLLSMSEAGNITEEVFSLALGVAKESQVQEIVKSIMSENAEVIKNLYDDIFKNNIDLKSFCSQISHELFKISQSGELQDSFSIAKDESFWIFEAYQKEVNWGLESLNPREVILLIFQKIALRGEFFLRSEKKNSKSESERETIAPVSVKKAIISFSWKGFVSFIQNKNLAISQNLKRALLLNEAAVAKGEKTLNVSYVESDEVLFNFISESLNIKKLEDLLKEFSGRSDVGINFTIIADVDKLERGFVSIEEEDEIKIEKEKSEKEKKLRANTYVVEALEIFDSKIDKISIKD
jgi:DNA polymerase-3 subunit gamma/tau